MKSKITFKCRNEDCEEYDKLYDISDVIIFGDNQPKKLKAIASAAYFGHCNKCIGNGNPHIEHGERLFRSFEELGAYLHGLANEYKLLKRIVDGGIGTDEDDERFQELTELLTDVKCNTCGQSFINELCGS